LENGVLARRKTAQLVNSEIDLERPTRFLVEVGPFLSKHRLCGASTMLRVPFVVFAGLLMSAVNCLSPATTIAQTATESATQEVVSREESARIKALIQAEIKELANLDLKQLLERLDENWQQYAQQLQAVLKTRTMEEREFLARVIVLVQQERVPKKLVDSAWLWVRNKRAGSKYPFIYFERVLRLEAEKGNFLLPDFDRDSYNNRDIARQRLRDRLNRR